MTEGPVLDAVERRRRLGLSGSSSNRSGCERRCSLGLGSEEARRQRRVINQQSRDEQILSKDQK